MKFFDGAFGTYYLAKTGDLNACELANISNKNVVTAIHEEYIKVGVNAIKTNTFNANPTVYNIEELREIIKRGYDLAKQAVAGTGVSVYADIGNIDGSEAALQYTQVADIFIELGATNFLFETLCEFDALKPALQNIKAKVKNSTIQVSFAVSQDGFSRKGLYFKSLINDALSNANVDVVGLNCVCGPGHILSLTKKLDKLSKPISIMPNAGYPSVINGRTVFQDNAEYFAQKLVELTDLGVSILGGCCGTTPKHIELAVKAISTTVKPPVKSITARGVSSGSTEKKIALKPIYVELDPPTDSSLKYLLSSVDKLKACGVETITLADSPLAKARADSVLTAAKIMSKKSIDVLPHMTCRDKNHIAIKGSLLGAGFFGVNKILAVMGDPVYDIIHKKSGVFDFNSIQLISYIKSLNDDVFSENPFSIGGALNVNALNFEAELKRCRKKLESGASFLLTQPIFTDAAITNFKRAKQELNCKLFAGILPVAGYKNAVFLNNEVAGIDIPEAVLDRLKDKAPDEVNDISIDFSRSIITGVYDLADGFYIMTPLKKVNLVCELIKRCFDV